MFIMKTKADKLRNFATHRTTCAARIGMLIVMLLPSTMPAAPV